MSDDERNKITAVTEEILARLEKPRLKKQDKRKETSKINAAKARQIKLEKIANKNKPHEFEIETDSESESDSEDEIIIKKKVKGGKKENPLKSEIDELKNILASLKPKEGEGKQEIQNPPKTESIEPKQMPYRDDLQLIRGRVLNF